MYDFSNGYFKFPNGEYHTVKLDEKVIFVDGKEYNILKDEFADSECIFYESNLVYAYELKFGISLDLLYGVTGRNDALVGTCKIIKKDSQIYRMKINLESGISFIYECKQSNNFVFCDIPDINLRIDFSKIINEE